MVFKKKDSAVRIDSFLLKKLEELEKQVRELVAIALQRSIQHAVKAAERETPYLLDELHDHLVDDYYEKLVALRKIKNL